MSDLPTWPEAARETDDDAPAAALVPVVMAGGSGTRLWPLSRRNHPKQFLALTGGLSLLQETVARLRGLGARRPLLVCNEEHRFLAAEQMRLIGEEEATILLEPAAHGTAPAIGLAALHAAAGGDDPLLLVLAADHAIADVGRFHEAVRRAVPLAGAGHLVTFGIAPDRAETGYGYIRRGEAVAGGRGFRVAGFVEKPDEAAAQALLASGGCFWNSGMFLFRAGLYLRELERHRPDIAAACRLAMAPGSRDMQFVRVDAGAFSACASISIDCAIMEKTDAAVMVPLDAGWTDIGSWAALGRLRAGDDDANSLQGDVLAFGSRGNLVHAGDRLVALLGVEDLVVVETRDAVLVAGKARARDVGRIVDSLAGAERGEHVCHRKVYRPWGHYEIIDRGERHQVKRITVKPGAGLSMQRHRHRAEHWVVVRGTARVRRGEAVFDLTENQSTYIPPEALHALENAGDIPLEVIEVQSGSYLGEDDIVRVEDRYGRS